MTGRRIIIASDDRVGQELRVLARQRATTVALAQSETLLDHPLIDELANPADRTERARVLSQLIQCSLLLAFNEWQADRGNLLAGDALAAGTLFGLLSQRPVDAYPVTLPLRVNNWTNERRQLEALQWAGSHAAATSRSARAWRDTYLTNWREFFHLVELSGELERSFRDHFASSGNPIRPTRRERDGRGDDQHPAAGDSQRPAAFDIHLTTATQGIHGLYRRALTRLHQFQEKP